ncbi:MAG: helix-turn-helix domain-containing protein [Gammaproteobacteria bacterium]|nr:helix-turn-helix domain-containing protein [Gammaproteobacteria bacterium]
MNRARDKTGIPAFALYGEAHGAPPDMLHIEPIQSRSRLHRWAIDAHRHRALHQILWIAAGPAEVALDELRESCAGPIAIVVPPGTVHGFRFTADTEGFVLTLDPRAVIEGDLPTTGDALRELFGAPRILRFAAHPDATARVDALVRELALEFATVEAAGSPVPLWLARAIVWRLARHGVLLERGTRRTRAPFTRFLMLIEAHHRRHWPVSQYAGALGLTVERLNRIVRTETGKTALELVHERLAREACRRLIYTAAPVATIAADLGFRDAAYFCRFFKRRRGQGPRDYRGAVRA